MNTPFENTPFLETPSEKLRQLSPILHRNHGQAQPFQTPSQDTRSRKFGIKRIQGFPAAEAQQGQFVTVIEQNGTHPSILPHPRRVYSPGSGRRYSAAHSEVGAMGSDAWGAFSLTMGAGCHPLRHSTSCSGW